jgi:hypothetical protein
MFSLQQNRRIRGQNRFCQEVWGRVIGEVSQTMYTHVNKCKNDKIKRNYITEENVSSSSHFFFLIRRKCPAF